MAIKATFVFTLEYASDIEAAKRFFVDVLSLEVERDAPTFVQFKDRNGASFAISSGEPIGGAGRQEIYWSVDDANAALRELSKTAEVSVPIRELPFGKVFAIKDPAKQTHFFVEFAQVRPSAPVG